MSLCTNLFYLQCNLPMIFIRNNEYKMCTSVAVEQNIHCGVEVNCMKDWPAKNGP